MRQNAFGMAVALAACGLGLASVQEAKGDMVYLALGDSVTFGIDPSTPAAQTPSLGDQGFVKLFADHLGTLNGGVRPGVVNLAVPGELSSSFFDAVSPPGWTNRVPQLNGNYQSAVTKPQHDLMVETIAAIQAAGDTIDFVSLAFGANDIFHLTQTPDFLAASFLDQQTMLGNAIGAAQMRYLTVLGELKSLLPGAKLLLPGYYNAFPEGSPLRPFFEGILSIYNPLMQANADAFDGAYVDLYTPFQGRELELTNIGIGDNHPNQAGYAVIAGAFAQAVPVPEPGSALILACGLAGVSGYGWRRSRRGEAR